MNRNKLMESIRKQRARVNSVEMLVCDDDDNANEVGERPNLENDDYEVESKYKVAKYDPENVKESYSDIFHTASIRNRHLLRSAYQRKTFKYAILGVTWKPILIFLVLYYVFQVLYQLKIIQKATCYDYNSNSNSTSSVSANVTFTLPESADVASTSPVSSNVASTSPVYVNVSKLALDPDDCGKVWGDWVEKMKEHESSATKYLTFLLGFYVGQMIKRWWDQVRSLPEIDWVSNCLAGFVQIEFKDDLKSKAAGLALKKRLVRYCLLSWTMCLATISPKLQKLFNQEEHYVGKELITKAELKLLKDGSSGYCMDRWWVPITWAISLINANHPESQGCKIKDQKDFIKALSIFHSKLHDVSLYQSNPLPLIYGQAVVVAIYAWILLGVFASQGGVFTSKYQNVVDDPSFAFFSIPWFQLVKVILIYAWLQVANIARNPFGMNEHYHINLEKKLDINIWKASMSIKHMDNPIYLQF